MNRIMLKFLGLALYFYLSISLASAHPDGHDHMVTADWDHVLSHFDHMLWWGLLAAMAVSGVIVYFLVKARRKTKNQ